MSLGPPPTPIAPPPFDTARVRAGIVHLGLGGFARAHLARYTHDLMAHDPEALRWGIVGVGLRVPDRPLIETLAAQRGRYTLIERGEGVERMQEIGSLTRVIDASTGSGAVLAAIDDPAIGIVSLTVTEHGYCLDRATKRLDLGSEAIARDLLRPHDPATAIGILVEAYRRRRAAGLPAFTALSCDNIEHNGRVLRQAVLDLAAAFDPVLARWIEAQARFPSAMVDRITPVPTAADTEAFHRRTGSADRAPLMAEPFRQWVIEDDFVRGERPRWEAVGAQFVADVAPYEFMKLRLLNTSHLVVAGLGQLCGHRRIDEAMADPPIRRTMEALMERETGPTLGSVPGIDLALYKRQLVERFANPSIRDTVARVNADAPLNYLLDPIRDRLAANAPIDLLALGLAAWLRRVRGDLAPVIHPLADELRARAIEGGDDPAPLLSLSALFGSLGQDERLRDAVGRWLVSLYAAGGPATLAGAQADGLI